MSIKFEFQKENLVRLCIAMILAAVLYGKVRYALWVLPVFGALYFLVKSLRMEIGQRAAAAVTAVALPVSAVFTAYLVQYLLLDAELRAKITREKMWLNIVCCLVVFLVAQVFVNNTGLTCMTAHLFLMTLAGINYFVYLFRANEFIFSDLKSIQTGLSVAGNYEFTLDVRAAYVLLCMTLYIALVRKLCKIGRASCRERV